jgi:hypothetical protein
MFSILHFGYDLTHLIFLIPFCGVNESVFQHLKMAFWSYLFTNLIEYFIEKEKILKKDNFWYPRLLTTIIVPWFVILVWYLVPALIGKLKSTGLEIIWAIFTTYISGIMGGVIEKNFENHSFNLKIKILILILFIISAFLYIRFTYSPPWIDLFENPETL